MLAAISAGEVRFAVNTPSPEPGVVSDAARIRQTTVAEGLLCFTSIRRLVRWIGSWWPPAATCGLSESGRGHDGAGESARSRRGVALRHDSDRQACRDLG
jgi:hypothetical protein